MKTEKQLILGIITGLAHHNIGLIDEISLSSEQSEGFRKLIDEQNFISYCVFAAEYMDEFGSFEAFMDHQLQEVANTNNKYDRSYLRAKLDRLSEMMIALLDENGEKL